ncbi:MFS transporter [Nakamurella lactea]|uniref:MFS transporter n=1 Tax=Nakamurella lactea TaxID=459515 RepID=UPI000429CD27|nr:MFS transporter [Nakamurella lactea]
MTDQTGTAQRRSLFHHHDFRWLWIGDTASQLGAAFGALAVPYLAVTALGASEFQMGLLGTLTTLGFLIIGLPSGALIDRWRKRNIMIIADLGRAALLLTLPVAWWAGWLTFAQLAVVATIVGMLQVFFDVSYQSYLPTLVHSDQVVEGNAKLQASQSVSQAVGPALGGLLIKLAGAVWSIGINAVGYLISAVTLLRIRHRETPPTPAERQPLVTEIAEGLKFVVGHPLLKRLIACTGIGNLFNSIGQVLIVFYMVQLLHLSALTIGIIDSVAAVGGLAGALVITKLAKTIGEGPSIILTAFTMVLFSFSWVLAWYLPATPVLLITQPLMMASLVAYNIATVSFRQRLCPPKLLGRMNASARFLVWGTMPIGSFIGGVLGHRLGTVPTLWIAAAGGALCLLPLVFSPLWTLRTLPKHTEDPEGDKLTELTELTEAAPGGLTTESPVDVGGPDHSGRG